MGCPTLAIYLRLCLTQFNKSTKTGVKSALPNTQKQTQGGCQNEETKKYEMKEQPKTTEKELNEMEKSNPSDAEFKTGLSICSRNSLVASMA